MATDYNELTAEVMSWLSRSDTSFIIPDFIASAEDWLNENVVHFRREMEFVTPVLSPERYNIPTDFHDAVVVSRNDEDVTVLYRAKIPRLSDLNITNWLLVEEPTLYRLASLVQAEGWLKNDPRIPVWKAQAAEHLAALNARGSGVFPTPDKTERRPTRILPMQGTYRRLQYVSSSEIMDLLGSQTTMVQNGGRQVWSMVAGQIYIAPET